MILGVGVDTVLLARVESAYSRFGDRFSKKILSVQERSSGTVDARLLAKRFAVKEAIAKALGTGFRGGITMPSMSIVKTELNAPKVILSGAALERLERLGGSEVLVSISDEVDSVIAFAIVGSSKEYTMNYTIEEWEKTETLFIGNDQTAQFSFTYDEMFTASLGIQFVISYEESNEFLTSTCDDVTVEPDFSNTAGPHDDVDDSAKSTSTCDSSEQLMASIVTDNSLLEFGSIPGAYTANGTMSELENNAERMNNIDRMMGTYEAGVTVATNSNPITADSGESITITWRALLLVAGDITPV